MHKTRLKVEAMHPFYVGELESTLAKVEAMEGAWAGREDEISDQQPDKNYGVVDGIGIYRINGPLLSTGNWLTRFFGMASYEDIRADLMQMSADPDVQEILVLTGSPGGSVFGITDAAEAIKKIDKVTPVFFYSSKNAASGAYWLASCGRTLIGSPESEWGSIGVVVTHASYEKQLEEDGVKITVIKSDELKAVGGPYKDLSDREIAHIQEQVDQYDDLFKEHVRTSRPQVKLSSMKGQTFIGAEAQRMGLIDAVMSYDQAIDYIKGQRKTTTQTGGYRMKMTAEQLRAAVDAGNTLEDLGITQAEADEIMASAAATDEGVQIKTSEGSVEVDAAQAELLDQLAALTEEGERQRIEIAELTQKLEEAQAVEPVAAEMRGIVISVLNNRRVALGLAKVDMEAFSDASILADYKAVTEQFDKAMVVGGIFNQKKADVSAPTAVKTSIEAGLMQAAAIK